MSVEAIMRQAPVIPVMVIDDVKQAVPLAHALVRGGLSVLEITLRTPVAMEAISAIAAEVPGAKVGVGTVTQPDQVAQSLAAGATFVVTPGFSTALAEACQHANLPLLPGVATPSDIVNALASGCDHLKFFPAGPAGGTNYLKALHGPFPEVRFCPTGGVNADNYHEYLSLPNVLCVGGSWVCPSALVKAGEWDKITTLAAACRYPDQRPI